MRLLCEKGVKEHGKLSIVPFRKSAYFFGLTINIHTESGEKCLNAPTKVSTFINVLTFPTCGIKACESLKLPFSVCRVILCQKKHSICLGYDLKTECAAFNSHECSMLVKKLS